MKKLLLTSAIVAVAGAAAAEITWTGDAELKWNSHTEDATAKYGWVENATVQDNGLSLEAGIDATATAELDNGITASIAYGFDFETTQNLAGENILVLAADAFPTLTLESSMATLTVGDVETSYVETFGDDMMPEVDGELVADIDTTYGPAAIGISYVIQGDSSLPGLSAYTDLNPFGAISTDTFTAVASGNVNGIKAAIGVAGDASPVYSKDEGYAEDQGILIGVMAGYELNGIDVAMKYETQANRPGIYLTDTNADGKIDHTDVAVFGQLDTSLFGVDLGYTMSNGVSLGAEINSTTYGDLDAVLDYEVSAGFDAMGADITVSYSDTIDDFDTTTGEDIEGAFAIDAAYEVLPGLTVLAGYDMGEDDIWDADMEAGAYIATSYDLGGGASVFASYAGYDEAGDAEYDAGATLGLALTF